MIRSVALSVARKLRRNIVLMGVVPVLIGIIPALPIVFVQYQSILLNIILCISAFLIVVSAFSLYQAWHVAEVVSKTLSSDVETLTAYKAKNTKTVTVRRNILGDRVLDVAFTLLLVVLFLPLFAVISASLIFSGRPIFIAHRRVGKNGEIFPCLKFRTMVADGNDVLERHIAQFSENSKYKTNIKPIRGRKLTLVEALLRKTSLDELPQLINVIRGEMSLIGPRALSPNDRNVKSNDYAKIYSVVPGFTGDWRINTKDYSQVRSFGVPISRPKSSIIFHNIAIVIETMPAMFKRRSEYVE